jgi:hypothetical protein
VVTELTTSANTPYHHHYAQHKRAGQDKKKPRLAAGLYKERYENSN